MLRNSKTCQGNSAHRIWIVAFPMSLMLLMAVSRLWFLHPQRSHPVQDVKSFPIKQVGPAKKGHGYPPILAYWICGTSGDANKMLRLLKAIYHPRNHYLLQLDADSSSYERTKLLVSVQSESLYQAFQNVDVVGRSYAINKMGSSGLSATLHAAALLLKLNNDWDWFINLSPDDYPLMSPDDFLHAMSSLPRELNFVHYASETEWSKKRKVSQIVLDPSLHLEKRSDLFYAVETRTEPEAFRIYGGSSWMILTRSMMEFCVQGWENLPRKLLMYFNNVVYPSEFYFHTVICNSPEFKNTTVDTHLLIGQAQDMSAVFGRAADADMVDENILHRLPDGVVPGKWCLDANYTTSLNLCSAWGNIDSVRPGPSGTRLALLFSKLKVDGHFNTNSSCL